MIKRNLTIKIQGNRSVCDAPLYLHTLDKNIHVVITVVNNKFEIQDNMLLSYTLIKPNGDEVDRAECYIDKGQCHLLFSGEDFDELTEVGQHLIQLKLYDEYQQARLSLPPFAMHVLKNCGCFFGDEVIEGLLAEQNAYKLMDENRKALKMNKSILISDLEEIVEPKGYVPVAQEEATYKLDISNLATQNYVTNAIAQARLEDEENDIDLSGYATKDDLLTKADKEHVHSQYITEQNISHLATKEELEHNHDNQYAPIEHVHTQYLKEHQDISHLADKEHTHSYNNLEDLPTIPSIEGLATEDYVNNAIANLDINTDDIDLSSYATKEELATKADKEHAHEQYLTALQGVEVFATKEHTHTDLATKDEVNVKADKTYVNSTFLSNYMAENNYAKLDHNHDFRYSQLDHTHSGYATQNDLVDIQTSINNKADADHIHTEYSKTGHTHSYNDLTDKPTIPSVDGLATETYVNQAITNIESEYAKKTDIPTVPTKTSELTNDSGFIINIPSEYVTETELQARGYLTEHQDLSHLALKTEIPSVPSNVSAFVNDAGYITEIPSQYITEYELSLKGYLTEHQDLTGYALTTDLPTHTSDLANDSGFITEVPSEYVTEEELTSKGYLTEHQNISHLATKSELNGMVTSQTVVRIEVVDELPSTQETGVLYIVKGS